MAQSMVLTPWAIQAIDTSHKLPILGLEAMLSPSIYALAWDAVANCLEYMAVGGFVFQNAFDMYKCILR